MGVDWTMVALVFRPPLDRRRAPPHTCGTGHIRFWKLATTFTELKLQGSMGKFGKVGQLSVGHCGVCRAGPGKVVSGTETGSLLLWKHMWNSTASTAAS